jgi:hypothetical protein
MNDNMYVFDKTTNITVAKINGRLIEFDICNSGEQKPPVSTVEHGVLHLYLGAGIIHSLNGRDTEINTAYHFWKMIPLAKIRDLIS